MLALAPAQAAAGDQPNELHTIHTHLNRGQHTRALTLLRGYVHAHPGSLRAQILYQDVMRAAGKTDELRKEYRRQRSELAGDPEARYLYARTLEPSRAIPELRAVLKARPNFAPAYTDLAGALLKRAKGRERALRRAEKAARKAVSLAPEDARGHEILGAVLEGLGALEEAETSYRSAMEVSRGSYRAHFRLAHLLARRNQSAEGLRVLDRIVDEAKENPLVYVHRGLILGSAGRTEDAVRAYEESIRLAPPDPLVLVLLARSHAELAEWDSATDALQRALDLDPELAAAYAVRGYMALRRGLPDAAIDSYKRAIRYEKRNASHYYSLGVATEKAGRPHEALQHYRRAAQIDPENPDYRLVLGAVHERRGRPGDALAAYKKATVLSPEDPDGWIRYGHVAADLRRYRVAAGAFQRAVELDPDRVEILKSLGIVNEMRRRKDEAIAAYKLYLRKGGKDKRVRAWLTALTTPR